MAIGPRQLVDVRERIPVGLADARRALDASDGDIEAAVRLLRAEAIAELGRRTGADGELCARTFDEAGRDVERATIRLRALTLPEPPSLAVAILDSDQDDESAARDLGDCLGNAGERGPAADVLYRVIDLWTRVEADGLDEYLRTTPDGDDRAASLSALRAIGSAEVAEAFAAAIGVANAGGPPGALHALDERFYDRAADLARLVMTYARQHRAELWKS